VKVMMSAVVVGMIGIYALHTAGWSSSTQAHPLRSQIRWAGFSSASALACRLLSGYRRCSLGQGNFDAIASFSA